MDKESYIRCAKELEETYRGVYRISRAGCLFAATAIEELLTRAEKAERERDAAQTLLAEMSDVTGCNKISTCFGYPLEEVRELLEEHRRGKVHVFKFGLRSYVYRAWVHPSGNAAFITKHWMGTIQDLANAEMWGNAYATYKEAVDTLYDGK